MRLKRLFMILKKIMKSLFILVFLPVLTFSQGLKPIIFPEESSALDLVSGFVETNDYLYSCELKGSNFGTFDQLVFKKFDKEDSLVLINQINHPYESLIACHLFEWQGEIWFLGTYYKSSIQEGGLIFCKINDLLEMYAVQTFDTGIFYADRLAYSIKGTKLAVGGSLASSSFVHHPFILLFDEQMDVVSFKQGQEGAFNVESILYYDDFYILLGAGLWKYNLDHELIGKYTFDSPSEVCKTKSCKLSGESFLLLKRVFIWDTGEWVLSLEEWGTNMILNQKKVLDIKKGVEDLGKLHSLQRTKDGHIRVSAYSYFNKIAFPFVKSSSGLHYWCLASDFKILQKHSIFFTDFYFPYNVQFLADDILIGGFFADSSTNVDPYLFRLFYGNESLYSDEGPFNKEVINTLFK